MQAKWMHHGLFLIALASVIVIGSSRPVVSEATGAPRPTRAATLPIPTADPSMVRLAARDDALQADEDDRVDGAFVPAIYAWDPDVRFVYFRQVSKWM